MPFSTHRDPTSLNDTDLGIPCMGAYGGPIDPNVALGDFGECHIQAEQIVRLQKWPTKTITCHIVTQFGQTSIHCI